MVCVSVFESGRVPILRASLVEDEFFFLFSTVAVCSFFCLSLLFWLWVALMCSAPEFEFMQHSSAWNPIWTIKLDDNTGTSKIWLIGLCYSSR